MKICMIGVGYVGLVSGACFADLGNTVLCVDKDKKKIDKLNQNIMPFFEPGLKDIVTKFNDQLETHRNLLVMVFCSLRLKIVPSSSSSVIHPNWFFSISIAAWE